MLKIKDESKNLISVDVSGKLTENDITSFKSSVDQKTSSGSSPFNVLLDVQSFDGIEFSAIDDIVTQRPKGKFRRVAIVGDGDLEKFASKVAKPFFKADMRHFSSSESATARQWVSA